MQVVPVALLEFSRSVMRERFSSILHKPVYTFTFDRFTAASPQLLSKVACKTKLPCKTKLACKTMSRSDSF